LTFQTWVIFILQGRIALQASAGGDPTSETYFDNIVVTSLEENNLNVPYCSQNSLPWGPTENTIMHFH